MAVAEYFSTDRHLSLIISELWATCSSHFPAHHGLPALQAALLPHGYKVGHTRHGMQDKADQEQ